MTHARSWARVALLAGLPLLAAAGLTSRFAGFFGGLLGALACTVIALGALGLSARARLASPPRVARLGLGAACGAGFVALWQNVLVHDALQYYGYLRSAIVDGDLTMFEESVLANPHGMYLPPPGAPVAHIGTALAELPLAIVARPFALLLARFGRMPAGDGFGPIETAAATLTAVAAGLAGVALTHRLARRVAGTEASALAQAVLLFASPLAFFLYVWPGYPHAFTVPVAAAFMLTWLRSDPGRGRGRPFLLGILGGVLALFRPQDVVYLALPALDHALVAWKGRTRARHAAWPLLRAAGLVVAGTVVGFLPQLVVWIRTAGRPLPHVYAERGDPFIWSRPAFLEVLLSHNNGLLTWTPICGIAIAGLVLCARRSPRLARGLGLVLLLQWWAIASYGYWWGGASFGARYFLSAWPVFGVGLACVAAWSVRRVGILATGMAATPFVYWNLLLMAQYRLEWIPHNQQSDFAAALARQLTDAPAALLHGLTGSFGWNQAQVLELIRAARAGGSVPVLAAALFGAFGAFLAVALIVARIAEDPGKWRPRRQAVVLTVAAIVAGVAVGVVADGLGARRLVVHARDLPVRIEAGRTGRVVFVAADSRPSADMPTRAALAAARPRSATDRLRLDAVHFLAGGEERRQGTVVAEIDVVGARCNGPMLVLRAGIETAETAPGRVEAAPTLSHDPTRPRIVQTWWQRHHSRAWYFGHAYGTSWRLPPGCVPSEALVHATPGAGAFELRRLAVSVEAGPEDRSGGRVAREAGLR